MKISKVEFERLHSSKELVVTIIGMSNVGKSYWSNLLQQFDFEHICCDDIIEKHLGSELKALGYSGIHDLAKWLGQPYSPDFKEREKQLLDLEEKVYQDILDELQNIEAGNKIIDTPGSFAHCNSSLCEKIADKSLVVYIQATENMQEEMFKNFLLHPKPIIWQNVFTQNNENEMEALKRCYPLLLKYRDNAYKKYADIILPFQEVDYGKIDANSFYQILKSHLS